MTSNSQYEQKLKQFIDNQKIDAKHLVFEQSCHSVADAAQAAGCETEDFVKNICMIDSNNSLIVAIVKGEDRASTSAVGKHLHIERPRTATPDEILERTEYPCGGTPSFGFDAKFIIDPKVLEKPVVYTGGGSEQSLVRITPQELQKANSGEIIRIRK